MIRRVPLLVSVLLGAAVFAHDEPKGKPVTMTGTVVDTGCYMSHNGIGEKHVDCATACARPASRSPSWMRRASSICP